MTIKTTLFLLLPVAAFAQQQPAAPPQTDAMRSRYVNMVVCKLPLDRIFGECIERPKTNGGFHESLSLQP
jgi:hypothetical protein